MTSQHRGTPEYPGLVVTLLPSYAPDPFDSEMSDLLASPQCPEGLLETFAAFTAAATPPPLRAAARAKLMQILSTNALPPRSVEALLSCINTMNNSNSTASVGNGYNTTTTTNNNNNNNSSSYSRGIGNAGLVSAGLNRSASLNGIATASSAANNPFPNTISCNTAGLATATGGSGGGGCASGAANGGNGPPCFSPESAAAVTTAAAVLGGHGSNSNALSNNNGVSISAETAETLAAVAAVTAAVPMRGECPLAFMRAPYTAPYTAGNGGGGTYPGATASLGSQMGPMLPGVSPIHTSNNNNNHGLNVAGASSSAYPTNASANVDPSARATQFNRSASDGIDEDDEALFKLGRAGGDLFGAGAGTGGAAADSNLNAGVGSGGVGNGGGVGGLKSAEQLLSSLGIDLGHNTSSRGSGNNNSYRSASVSSRDNDNGNSGEGGLTFDSGGLAFQRCDQQLQCGLVKSLLPQSLSPSQSLAAQPQLQSKQQQQQQQQQGVSASAKLSSIVVNTQDQQQQQHSPELTSPWVVSPLDPSTPIQPSASKYPLRDPTVEDKRTHGLAVDVNNNTSNPSSAISVASVPSVSTPLDSGATLSTPGCGVSGLSLVVTQNNNTSNNSSNNDNNNSLLMTATAAAAAAVTTQRTDPTATLSETKSDSAPAAFDPVSALARAGVKASAADVAANAAENAVVNATGDATTSPVTTVSVTDSRTGQTATLVTATHGHGHGQSHDAAAAADLSKVAAAETGTGDAAASAAHGQSVGVVAAHGHSAVLSTPAAHSHFTYQPPNPSPPLSLLYNSDLVEVCYGVAYRIDSSDTDAVMNYLMNREKCGYAYV